MNYILTSILGAILLSISDIFSKYALNNNVSSLNFIFWSHGITYIVCLALLILLCRYYSLEFLTSNKKNNSFFELLTLNNDIKINLSIFLSGIFAFIALLCIIYSFKITENIGYTVAIISTTCLFTLIFSYFYFNSPIEKKGILGCLCIIVGIILISNCSNKTRF